MPAASIESTAGMLSHPSLSSVLGKDRTNVAAAKMPVYNIKHNLLSLRVANAICPLQSVRFMLGSTCSNALTPQTDCQWRRLQMQQCQMPVSPAQLVRIQSCPVFITLCQHYRRSTYSLLHTASPIVWTSGCLSLKFTSSQDVYVAQVPRMAIMMTPGTSPTTARAYGRDSMPFDTISAIIKTATSCHESVLYLICCNQQHSSNTVLLNDVAATPTRSPRRHLTYIVILFLAEYVMIMIGCKHMSIDTALGRRFCPFKLLLVHHVRSNIERDGSRAL